MRLITAVAIIIGLLSGSPAWAQADTSAASRMAEPGPEQRHLRQLVGSWDVTFTMWPAPDARPVVTRGLVAERAMVGSILQEIMRPGLGSGEKDFRRLDYLDFDRVEGRWKYVSMDSRFPVSIMPAAGLPDGTKGSIRLLFAPQAFVGFGPAVEGRFMLSDMVITEPSPDKMIKEQHVIMADGTGRSWRFVRYEYTRRR